MKLDVQAFLKPGETIQNQEILPISRTKAVIVGNTENRYYILEKKKEKLRMFKSTKALEAIILKPFPWAAIAAFGLIALIVGIGLVIGLPESYGWVAPLILGVVFLILGAFLSTKIMLVIKTSGFMRRGGYIISKRYFDNVVNFIQIVHGFAKLYRD